MRRGLACCGLAFGDGVETLHLTDLGRPVQGPSLQHLDAAIAAIGGVDDERGRGDRRPRAAAARCAGGGASSGRGPPPLARAAAAGE